ncbi:MAG: hypothetical protein JWP46_1604 [Modestobacter sp.]|jgi:hypothetical protein|nr:hypothetical protein [Modestobacter sp.]
MPRVALYATAGSPYNFAAILAAAGHEISFVFAGDVIDGALDAFDAFVMPGGGYRAMQGQLDPLGAAGCGAIRDYVERGGMYIGSCAGSYDAATVPERFRELCPAQEELRLLDARIWNEGSSRFGILQSPGIGEIVCDNVAPDHPVMAGMPARFPITHYNGPLFNGGQPLAVVHGRGDRFTPAEDFLGSGTGEYLLDDAAAEDVANIVAGVRGTGRVVLFGSHPEFGSRFALDDVGATARLLTNAVAWQLRESAGVERPRRAVAFDGEIARSVVDADRRGLPDLVATVTDLCRRLADRTDERWLDPGAAMSMFGAPPRQIWRAALERIPVLAAEAAAAVAAVPDPVVSFRPPPDWTVDPGVHGIVPLIEAAARQLALAETNWREDAPVPTQDPYDFMLDSPYHLVAGSYLAAIGNVAGAALLARAFAGAEAPGREVAGATAATH